MSLPTGKQFDIDTCGYIKDLTLETSKETMQNIGLTIQEIELAKDYLKKKSANPSYKIIQDFKGSPREKEELKNKFFTITEKLQIWNDPQKIEDKPEIIQGVMKNLKIKVSRELNSKVEYFTVTSTGFTPIDDLGVDCYFKIGEMKILIDVKSSEEAKQISEGKITDADLILYEPKIFGTFKTEEERLNRLKNTMIDQWSNEVIKVFEFKIKELREKDRRESLTQMLSERLSEEERREQRMKRARVGGQITKFK
uniref:Uncharacterized protein n=1 Tax=candidate division CPR3 bacterium TaxID=2268181 RepID=A0A7C4M2A7_UNCC3